MGGSDTTPDVHGREEPVSLDKGQLAFGERPRALRTGAGFATGNEFGAHLGWVAPRVSHIGDW